MPVSPEMMAAIDTAITMGFSTTTMLLGLKIGYKARREDEKVEDHNKEVEAKNDRRSLKD